MPWLTPLIRLLTSPILFRLALLATGLSAGAYLLATQVMVTTVSSGYDREQVMAALRGQATEQALHARIELALSEERIEDAELYVALANQLEVPVDEALLWRMDAANSPWRKTQRMGGDCYEGFVLREFDNVTQIGCGVTADLIGAGDLLDLIDQAGNYAQDKEVDHFIVALSAIGVAATAATVASGGLGTPTAVGAGVAKTAKRSGSLTKPLQKSIGKLLDDAVDSPRLLAALEKSGSKNPLTLARIAGKHIDTVNTRPLRNLFDDLADLRKHTSTADTVRLLKYADNPRDIRLLKRLSQDFGQRSRAVMSILGKRALKISSRVARFAKHTGQALFALATSAIASLLSGLGMLAGKLLAGATGEGLRTWLRHRVGLR